MCVFLFAGFSSFHVLFFLVVLAVVLLFVTLLFPVTVVGLLQMASLNFMVFCSLLKYISDLE